MVSLQNLTTRQQRFTCLILVFLTLVCAPFKLLADPCERIISAAPSITELTYAIGLGDHLVGVTRFCKFPPEAELIQSIGGFLDPNLEQIAALRPSMVFLLTEQDFLRKQLTTLGLKTTTIDHKSFEAIRASFSTIGNACGSRERTAAELSKFDNAIEASTSRIAGAPSVKTLVVVGKGMRGDAITSMYVSGTDGYYHSIVRLAGGTPAYSEVTVSVPTLSGEGLRAMNPDAIIDIVDRDDSTAMRTDEDMLAAWSQFKGVPAIDNKRVLILRDDFASVPGPRAPLLVEKIAKFLHPERFQK